MSKKNPYDMEHEEFQEHMKKKGYTGESKETTSQAWHATDEAKNLFNKYLASKDFRYDAGKEKIVPVIGSGFAETVTSQADKAGRLKAKGGKVKKNYANGGTIRKPRRA